MEYLSWSVWPPFLTVSIFYAYGLEGNTVICVGTLLLSLYNVSARSGRLEVTGARKNEARERLAFLPRTPINSFLRPLVPSACHAG